MRHNTLEVAKGRWHGILTTFGVDHKYLVDKHGPCPFGCGGKKSFRWDDKGTGSWICTHCGAGHGFHFLKKIQGWDDATTLKEIDKMVGNVEIKVVAEERSESQKKEAIKAVLSKADKLRLDDPAFLYLSRRCGPLPSNVLSDLRYHPAMAHPCGGKYPCLLAIVRHPDRSGASLHRTFLTMDGRKADVEPVRMMMPGKLDGAAIMLGDAGETIGIAEGLETALCARALFGVPVWSVISANGMIGWTPPEGVRSVVVYGDNDLNFIGQHAAFTLARKLFTKGLNVEVRIPEQVGHDWADVWAQGETDQGCR